MKHRPLHATVSALALFVQACAPATTGPSTLSAHPPRPADLARPGKAATEKKATPEPEVRATIMRGDQQFPAAATRSEEHTSELQSLMRSSYAVFCLKNKKKTTMQSIDQYSPMIPTQTMKQNIAE